MTGGTVKVALCLRRDLVGRGGVSLVEDRNSATHGVEL